MFSKRNIIIFGFSSLLGILVLVVALAYAYLHIPNYVESKLLPEMVRKAGISEYAFKVRRIDFSGADLGSLRIGDQKNPALSIAAVQIDYSPSGLYRMEIERIAFNGIELSCEYKDGEFIIQQFDLKTFLAHFQSSDNKAPSSVNTTPPLVIKRLEIKNALIVFEWKGKRLRLPIEFEILPGKKDRSAPYPNEFDCDIRLYPRGQKIVLASNIHLLKKRILLDFEAKRLHLERFSDYAKLIPGLALSGEVDIEGKTTFQYQPFTLSSTSATCQFQTAEMAYDNLRLKYVKDLHKKEPPFRIEINTQEGKEWRVFASSISPISSVSPISMLISGMSCDLKFSQDAAAGSGQFDISMKEFNGNQTVPIAVLSPLDLKSNFSAKLEKDGRWNFRIESAGDGKKTAATKSCKFRINNFDVFVDPPAINITGKGVNSKGFAAYKVVASQVKVSTNSAVLQTPSISLKGNAGFNHSEKHTKISSTYKIAASDIKAVTQSTTVQIPSISMKGNGGFSHSGKHPKVSTTYQIVASDVKTTARSGTLQIPYLSLIGSGGFSHSGINPEVSATYKIEASDVKALTPSATLQIPALSLNGKGGLDASPKICMKFASYELKASDTIFKTPSLNMNIPSASLVGKVREEKDRTMQSGGLFKVEDIGITMSKPIVKIDGIHGSVPFQWPLNGTGQQGKFSIKKLEWKNRNLGSANGTIQQKDLGLVFNGAYTSSLLPDLVFDVNGTAETFEPKDYKSEIHFTLNNYKTASDIDLGQFFPSATGATLNGELGLNGALTFDTTGMKGTLNAILNNANLMLKEKKAAMEGIRASLSLTDLFNMRSAPKQEFSFEKASLGELSASNGKIVFQIESPKSFFIEKSGFNWCDGNVYTQAMRIYPGVSDYDLILYCDRLKFAKILEQFGSVNAKGNGTLSGRLPITIENGQIRFNDGFLFSTPGEGGSIRVTGTEIFTAGIPPDTPQYAQIELAREALKDYDYQWAKMNIVSIGEDVLLRLQFDGKPAHPLPFVYNKEIGNFAKIEAGGKESVFQGIGLDVNFRVPLNKILYYKDIFNMIQ
ncbi:YdbH domain-containing protein [Thermodesulfobacteriota bacterium]